MGRKIIAAAAIVLGLMLAVPLTGAGTHTDYAAAKQEQQLQEAKVTELMTAFTKTLTEQQTNDEGKVQHLNSRQELLDEFANIAERDAVEPFIDELYREQDGKLYLNPTEWPPAFNEQLDYDMVELTEDRVEVKQRLDSAIYGNLIMHIHFHYSEGIWKIARITYEQAAE